MQIASRGVTYDVHSKFNKPQIYVDPGEIFLAETELCSGGWLKSAEDVFTPDKARGVNPAVCIGVNGARPGGMLAVDILGITPDAIGYTGFEGGDSGSLPYKIKAMDWGHCTKTVRIDGQYIFWSDNLKLPVSPMIGVLGTAPAEEALYNSRGGPHGGNMDVQEVCTGSTVYLPIETDGALLHVGDAHALQGDGEINGAGGIECRSVVKLKVRLMERPANFRCVRIENAGYIMTVACGRTAEESFFTATEQLMMWMAGEYDYGIRDAYLLLGQVMEARSTQFVNPTSSYICKMPKRYL